MGCKKKSDCTNIAFKDQMMRDSSGLSFPGVTIGTIFTDTFARASLGSNWTIGGTGTFNCDGSGDLLVSGGASDFIKYAGYNAWTTCLENHTIVTNFKITATPSASTSGNGFGVRSINPSGRISYMGRLNCTNSVDQGKVIISYATNSAATTFGSAATATTGMALSLNDEIRMTVTRNVMTITITANNLTTGGSSTVSFTQPFTSPSTYGGWNNTGYVTIWAIGGTQAVHDITYSTVEKKNGWVTWVGDSITLGLFAGTQAGRFAQATPTTKTNTICGGGSDKTAEVLARVPEIILLNPKYVILMIGGNDKFFAIPAATTNANYLSILNQIKAAGIIVIHCYATPRDATNMTAWNAHILATYGGTDTVINTFTNLADPGLTTLAAAYDTDGTHQNAAGHAQTASDIDLAVPYIK